MLSNCGHDENYRYSGGNAGDQTGNEWYLRPWYSNSWTFMYRYPDPKVRTMICALAIEAAKNDNVGYDQWERTTFWTQLKKVGYRPSKITVKCEADCSSGVAAIVKATGYLLGIPALQNVNINMTTYNEYQVLTGAGFQAFNASKYLTSEANLSPGDIIQSKGHTATVVTKDGSMPDIEEDDVITDEDKRDIAAKVWEYLWSGDANRDNMYNRVIELLRYGADTNEKLDDVIARLNTNIPATEVTDKLYRLRKDESHTYTPDATKAEELERNGWTRENPIAMPDQVWVYEATNPYNADCILTTDFDEVAGLANQGWRSVGVVGVSTGSNPVYRLFNPFTGLHFYTDDADERSGLIEAGWKDEGEAFRVA